MSKRKNTLEQMFTTLLVSQSKLDREFSGNPQHKKYEAQLKSIDKNGDGVIDLGELCQMIDELAAVEKQRRLLKWAAIVTGVFALLTIAAVVGLVYAVVVLTKDTTVGTSGILTTKDGTSTPIATAQVIVRDGAKDLFNKSLNELAELSLLIFPTVNGGRIVHVAEIEVIANTSATVTTDAGNVYVIDASGILEQLTNKTAGTTSTRKLLDANDDQAQAAFNKMADQANNDICDRYKEGRANGTRNCDNVLELTCNEKLFAC